MLILYFIRVTFLQIDLIYFLAMTFSFTIMRRDHASIQDKELDSA